MGRQPCCDKVGLKKGPWTAEEDQKLISFILNHGHCCWRAVPKLAGLLRCGKSCRLRWTNYLRPDLKRGLLSESEEKLIIDLHSQLGNRWSKIAAHLPGRTDNEIKNYWNTHIKKKLKRMGIDPVTHRPIIDQAESQPSKPALDEATEETDTGTSKKAILQAATEVSCRSNDSEITEEADKSIDSVKAVKLEAAQLATGYGFDLMPMLFDERSTTIYSCDLPVTETQSLENLSLEFVSNAVFRGASDDQSLLEFAEDMAPGIISEPLKEGLNDELALINPGSSFNVPVETSTSNSADQELQWTNEVSNAATANYDSLLGGAGSIPETDMQLWHIEHLQSAFDAGWDIHHGVNNAIFSNPLFF